MTIDPDNFLIDVKVDAIGKKVAFEFDMNYVFSDRIYVHVPELNILTQGEDTQDLQVALKEAFVGLLVASNVIDPKTVKPTHVMTLTPEELDALMVYEGMDQIESTEDLDLPECIRRFDSWQIVTAPDESGKQESANGAMFFFDILMKDPYGHGWMGNGGYYFRNRYEFNSNIDFVRVT